jgi:hypothetical protein
MLPHFGRADRNYFAARDVSISGSLIPLPPDPTGAPRPAAQVEFKIGSRMPGCSTSHQTLHANVMQAQVVRTHSTASRMGERPVDTASVIGLCATE